MNTSTELITVEPGNPYAVMPVLDIQAAAARRQAVVNYTSRMMVKGVDYGVVPGTGDKPTLLKPGAEKLASLFGLSPRFEAVERVMDWTGDNHGGEPFFYVAYRCTLARGDLVVGQGIGSCNSWEKKYRYRNVYPEKATAEDKANGRLETRQGKNGRQYQVYIVRNPDPADVVNTIDKMAQKRALVAAVLIAVNASELFTQDVEDYSDIVDGDWTPAPAPAKNPPAPANGKPPAKTETPPSPLDAYLAQAEQRPSVQAAAFANGRLRSWANYVTDNAFDPAKAEYLNQVLDLYCGVVADNDGLHTKAAAEKARADYRQVVAAMAPPATSVEATQDSLLAQEAAIAGSGPVHYWKE